MLRGTYVEVRGCSQRNSQKIYGTMRAGIIWQLIEKPWRKILDISYSYRNITDYGNKRFEWSLGPGHDRYDVVS
jgi:hypothetical protein